MLTKTFIVSFMALRFSRICINQPNTLTLSTPGLSLSSPPSPVKFANGDVWPRAPLLSGPPPLVSVCGLAGHRPAEVSAGVEHMDVGGHGSSEVSAPLPIRRPASFGCTTPFKKQAYPMNSKRPEHLRLNL